MISRERAGFLEISGTHLYTVLHEVADPLARVLLIGPFGSERCAAYIPLVRWARFLAAREIEVLRYDYRGMGESTGVFEEMSFEKWAEDVEFLAGWLRHRTPKTPLILHGLEMGALLANRAFASGIADASLLWAPPASANEVLRSALLRHVTLENVFQYGQPRRPLSDYTRRLESGFLEVDGHNWSSRLWQDSFHLQLRHASASDGIRPEERPVRTIRLDKSAAPLVRGSAYEAMNPDLTSLFDENFVWIAEVSKKVSADVH